MTPGIFKSILRHSGASLRVLDVRGDASHCLDERCLIDAGRLCPNLSEVHLTGKYEYFFIFFCLKASY